MRERELVMTKFVASAFDKSSEYVFYTVEGERKFVARFKRGGKADFLKFLVKNFSVEEYFSLLDSGMAPVTALKTKGYVSAAEKKALKRAGYPATLEGLNLYLDHQVKKYAA